MRWGGLHPADLLRLLGNPIGGGEHPIGRRLHPYGRMAEGMAVDLALRLFGPTATPDRLETVWLYPTRGGADFRVSCRVEASSTAGAVLSVSVNDFGSEVARVRVTVSISRAPER